MVIYFDVCMLKVSSPKITVKIFNVLWVFSDIFGSLTIFFFFFYLPNRDILGLKKESRRILIYNEFASLMLSMSLLVFIYSFCLSIVIMTG